MPRFSARTINLVRRNVNDLLTATCRVERETSSTGTMGEPLHDWDVVQADVPCRVIKAGNDRSTSRTGTVGAQEALVEMYRLITPVGTNFAVDDRVVMSDGRVFQVVDVADGLTDEAFAGALITRQRGADG